MLVKLTDAKAATTRNGFVEGLLRVPAPLRLTMTYDQGKEMAHHKELAAATGIQVYFADPHAPWQRGSNENTNGLLRQYLPKGADLSEFDQAHLDGSPPPSTHDRASAMLTLLPTRSSTPCWTRSPTPIMLKKAPVFPSGLNSSSR